MDASPLIQQAPRGFLCSFTRGLNGPLLVCPCHTQTGENFTERAPCKASTAHFSGLLECPPAPAPTLFLQLLILSTFPLAGFLVSSSKAPLSSSMIRCFEDSEMLLQRAGGTSVFPVRRAEWHANKDAAFTPLSNHFSSLTKAFCFQMSIPFSRDEKKKVK